MPAWNPGWGGGTPQGAQNPYYQQTASYGWPTGTDFQTTPIAGLYRQGEPGVAWTIATSPYAGGLDPRSRFIQGQENRVEDAYRAAVATNPNLTREAFFATLYPQFQRLWQSLGPRGRGEQRGLYAPSARWQRWG